jgi:hypothetical protein
VCGEKFGQFFQQGPEAGWMFAGAVRAPTAADAAAAAAEVARLEPAPADARQPGDAARLRAARRLCAAFEAFSCDDLIAGRIVCVACFDTGAGPDDESPAA